MNAGVVVGHPLGGEDVVAVLPVGEVVGGEVRAGENDLVVEAVELDVLQSPALVNALRQQALPHPRQVRRVVHANLNLVGELGRQRGEQGGARCLGRLASASQRIGKNGDSELGSVAEEGISQGGDELMF